jgi:ABC-type multidrug transport system fused ATPase/permease subunit
MTALFRLVEPCSGTIHIDGIDVCKLGLRDLRSKISIIPQGKCMLYHTTHYYEKVYNNTEVYATACRAKRC